MTTSGTYVYTVNRDTIIRAAMLLVNKLEQSEVPTAQEVSDCSMFLNMLVKQWQGTADFAVGLKTWTRRHSYLFLNGTTGQYFLNATTPGWCGAFTQTTLSINATAGATTITPASIVGMVSGDIIGITVGATIFWTTISSVASPTITLSSGLPVNVGQGSIIFWYHTTAVAQQPLMIETCFLRDNQSNDVPIKFLTLEQYNLLPSKNNSTNVTDPSAIYYEWQLGSGVLYTDVAGCSDLSKYLCISYLEEIQDFNNPNDTPEYPQEYYLALVHGLARLIAPMFNAPWSQVLEDNYKSSLAIAQNKHPPEESVLHFLTYE